MKHFLIFSLLALSACNVAPDEAANETALVNEPRDPAANSTAPALEPIPEPEPQPEAEEEVFEVDEFTGGTGYEHVVVDNRTGCHYISRNSDGDRLNPRNVRVNGRIEQYCGQVELPPLRLTTEFEQAYNEAMRERRREGEVQQARERSRRLREELDAAEKQR